MKPEPTPKSGETKTKRAVRLSGLGQWAQREYRLGSQETSIGSGADNDLVLVHTTVSRKHAILRHQGSRYTITDLDSTNGTFLNGRRIKQTVAINPGDEVSFGAARFAMLGGTDVVPNARGRRSPARTFAAVTGIVLFAIVGFLATRYAIEMRRAGPALKPSSEEIAASRQPAATPAIPDESDAETSGTPIPPDEAEVAAPSPIWLKQLNDFRAAVNLPPVVSNEKLTEGDQKHAIYLLKNYATEIHAGILGPEVHTEDSSNSWYTPEGEEAGHASDIAEQTAPPGAKLPNPLDWAIEGWMVAPFHRLPILSPVLRQVGFAYECEDGMCVALLNVLSGTEPLPRYGAPLEHPILFPPDGAAIPSRMRALDVEWPNPLSGCDGFAFPTGLPMSVQLGSMVDAQLNSFSITRTDGAEVEACGFDANSYYNSDDRERTSVINNLRGHGAVIIVPRRPLDPGSRYDVVATVNGHDYKWSFSIAR
jgi:pSer/pThr/pTyr-binding forkhead associated (FHA) protein